MMFLQNRPKKKSKTKWIIITLALFLTLVFLSDPFGQTVSGSLFSIANPVLRGGQSTKGWWENSFLALRTKSGLLRENEELREKNNQLESGSLILNFLQKENEELKSFLGRTREKEYILSSVILRPSQSPFDTLIVDAGIRNGVEVGMKATVYGNILVGHVSDVFENSSKVKLISFFGEDIDAIVEKTGLAIVASGIGGENMKTELPNSIEIKSGDLIMTPGTFPLVLGLVERVEINLSDPFQKIFFRLPLNIQELKYVMLEKKERHE